jgi:thioredoxin-related protein
LSAQLWQADFTAAQEIAQRDSLPIVLVFQGSDWCAPCIKLDRNIWTNEEFVELAADHFVFVKADFPRRKSNKLSDSLRLENEALAEKYNTIGSFPLVVVMDAEGNVLRQTGYKDISPAEYFAILNGSEE